MCVSLWTAGMTSLCLCPINVTKALRVNAVDRIPCMMPGVACCMLWEVEPQLCCDWESGLKWEYGLQRDGAAAFGGCCEAPVQHSFLLHLLLALLNPLLMSFTRKTVAVDVLAPEVMGCVCDGSGAMRDVDGPMVVEATYVSGFHPQCG